MDTHKHGNREKLSINNFSFEKASSKSKLERKVVVLIKTPTTSRCELLFTHDYLILD